VKRRTDAAAHPWRSYVQGIYDLTVTRAGSKTPIIGPIATWLDDGEISTVVVRDAPGGGPPYGLIELDDGLLDSTCMEPAGRCPEADPVGRRRGLCCQLFEAPPVRIGWPPFSGPVSRRRSRRKVHHGSPDPASDSRGCWIADAGRL
jgi:hypothetical protein